jgi:hypothetical protein
MYRKLILFVAVSALTAASAQALEWVAYDGTTPDNAVRLNEGTEDAIVCRKNQRVGLLTDGGKCYSVKIDGKIDKKTMDDGFELLVDNSETEMEAAVAAATEGLYTQDQYDAAIAAATEGLYTQDQYDAAIAAATEGLYTQDQYDAAIAAATEGLSTQFQYEDSVWDKGWMILEQNDWYVGCDDGETYQVIYVGNDQPYNKHFSSGNKPRKRLGGLRDIILDAYDYTCEE